MVWSGRKQPASGTLGNAIQALQVLSGCWWDKTGQAKELRSEDISRNGMSLGFIIDSFFVKART